ncbi:kinesin motor domain-containing protein, partial [Dunaliella salina]
NAERALHSSCLTSKRRESLAINGSLMVLGRCLEALKHNQAAAPGAPQRVIPFRESKITHLFKDVLHGWGHLVLSVCVSPVAGDFDETAHVLRYAALATNISMASGPAAAPVQTSMSHLALGAAQEEAAVAGPASATSAGSAARVAELETELARVYEQLQEAEAHLVQAEASIRDEVVQEIQDVIRELRGSYEERMTDLTDQLTQRDARIQELDQQLAAALASQHHDNHHHHHHFQEGAVQLGQQIEHPEHREQMEVKEQQQRQQQQQHEDEQENREQHPHAASREAQEEEENKQSTLNKQGGRSRRATRGVLRGFGEGHVLRDATNDAEVGTSGAARHQVMEEDEAQAKEAVTRGGRKRVSKRHVTNLEAAEEGEEAPQPSSSHPRSRKRWATNAATLALPQVQEEGNGEEGLPDSNAAARQPTKRSRKSRASTAKGEQGGGRKANAGLIAPIKEAHGEEEAEGLHEHESASAEGPATLRQTLRQRRQTVRL